MESREIRNKLLSGENVISSAEIFKGKREVLIEHDNEFYRLIITKSGKLVLNK